MRPSPKVSVASRLWLLPLLFFCVLASACVSKTDHEALQAELAACQQSKAEVEGQVISWENRYDRESQRWENIGASVADAVPQALSEVHAERERIIELVPEQVRGEVTSYLDEYFNTVMTGFDRLAQDSQDMRIELMATNKALEALGQDTRSINTAIHESLSDEKGRRESVSMDLVDLIDMIVQYDQTRLSCDGCPERLKMRDKSREELLAFHQELMADLSFLQTFAASPTGDTASADDSEDDTLGDAAPDEADAAVTTGADAGAASDVGNG